jgi:hypothetical protein
VSDRQCYSTFRHMYCFAKSKLEAGNALGTSLPISDSFHRLLERQTLLLKGTLPLSSDLSLR